MRSEENSIGPAAASEPSNKRSGIGRDRDVFCAFDFNNRAESMNDREHPESIRIESGRSATCGTEAYTRSWRDNDEDAKENGKMESADKSQLSADRAVSSELLGRFPDRRE